MIVGLAAGLVARAAAWLPALLAAIVEVLVKPAAWLLLVVAILGGAVWGGQRQKTICTHQKRLSIEAARAVDQKVAAEAKAAMQQQLAERDAQLSDVNAKVDRYEQELSKRPGCSLDDPDLDGLSLVPDVLPGRSPRSPGNGGRHPATRRLR